MVVSVYMNYSHRGTVPEIRLFTDNGQTPWCATVPVQGEALSIISPSVSGDIELGNIDQGPVAHHGS